MKVRDESPVNLTAEALAAMKDKVERLKAAIPRLADEAKRTADYGDRSENAEYKDAKGKLRGAHRQILSLQDQIKRAVVIKSGSGAGGKITLGSTVVLETGGRALTFRILGPHEADPDKGIISDKSPLGAALIGHKKGDEVKIAAGKSGITYRVADIL